MSVGKIKIKYSSVLQEMRFFKMKKTEAGAEVYSPLKSSPALDKYIHERQGRLILQDLNPGDFFGDISAATNNPEKVVIDFIGTKADYDDLVAMKTHYTQKNKKEIDVNHHGHLPDAGAMFDKIKETTMEVVQKFENEKLPENSSIPESIEQLRQRIKNLDNDDVNLCFVGGYSSGKSTLINAILGYAVLPEALKSETAKMFRISSPSNGKPVGVHCYIGSHGVGEQASIEWLETEGRFDFVKGPDENSIRTKVKGIIDKCCGEKQHIQLQKILTALNKQPSNANAPAYVNEVIEVSFPIPLSKKLNFVIYDTPGTDSHYSSHYDVLSDALTNQNNSILIYVCTPDSIEGTGNSALINLLQDLEENNRASTTIDLGHSLFVLNKADSITKSSGFGEAKISVLKLKDKAREEGETSDFEEDVEGTDAPNCIKIDLAEKRLFFVSAMTAHSARACVNKVNTKDENIWFNKHSWINSEDEGGAFYNHNHIAKADHLTDAMGEAAVEELTKDNVRSDVAKQLVVNSGLFSLEREIINYGEKFALSVKAKGLVDAVSQLIITLQGEYGVLESNLKMEDSELDKKIDKLSKDVRNAIETAFEEFISDERNNEASSQLKRQLHLDDTTSLGLIKEAETIVDKHFGFFKNMFNSSKAREIHFKIIADFAKLIAGHKKIVVSAREIALHNQMKAFVDRCDDAIKNINDVSVEDRDFILGMPPVNIPEPSSRINIANYVKTKNPNKFDGNTAKKKYQADEKDELEANVYDFSDKCIEDYSEALRKMSGEIKDGFIKNIVKLSGKIRRAKDDRRAVQAEMEWCSGMLVRVSGSNTDLRRKIWGADDE